MPVIHVDMYEGRTIEQKRKLVTAMTDAVVNSLEVRPDAVHIILHEIPRHNVSVAGILASDRK